MKKLRVVKWKWISGDISYRFTDDGMIHLRKTNINNGKYRYFVTSVWKLSEIVDRIKQEYEKQIEELKIKMFKVKMKRMRRKANEDI